MVVNYYSILHLKRHCTKDDINKAFGKLVSKYVITNQVQDHSLITLCEAYEVLSEPFLRILYDQYGDEGIKKGIQSDELNIDPWNYHADVIATYSKYCALKNPISNLYLNSNSYLSINLKRNKGVPDIVKLRLKLTLNEIFNGSIKLVSVNRKLIQISDSTSNEMQTVKVNIPRGFPTGGILKSKVSKMGIELNDVRTLYIFTMEEIPHKIFKRDKMNLIMVKNVSLKQVLLGINISIKTLDNKILRVNITQIITPDYVKMVHNEGMPDMNNPTQRGAIIIKFNIIYPLYVPISDILCELFNENQINK